MYVTKYVSIDFLKSFMYSSIFILFYRKKKKKRYADDTDFSFREFQPMIFILDDSSLSSDQDINWFLV